MPFIPAFSRQIPVCLKTIEAIQRDFWGKKKCLNLLNFIFWVMWPSIISNRTIPSHVNDLTPVPKPAGLQDLFNTPTPSMVQGLPVLQSLHFCSHSLVLFHVIFPMSATVTSALHYSVCLFSLISWTVRRNSITQCNMFFVVFMILTFTLHTSAIIYSNLHKYSVWCT